MNGTFSFLYNPETAYTKFSIDTLFLFRNSGYATSTRKASFPRRWKPCFLALTVFSTTTLLRLRKFLSRRIHLKKWEDIVTNAYYAFCISLSRIMRALVALRISYERVRIRTGTLNTLSERIYKSSSAVVKRRECKRKTLANFSTMRLKSSHYRHSTRRLHLPRSPFIHSVCNVSVGSQGPRKI